MSITGRELRDLLRTPPPFALKPARRSDGSYTFTHSGWQHALMPLFCATLLLAVAAGLIAILPGSNASFLTGLLVGLAHLFCLIVALVLAVVAWRKAGRGHRLRIDPIRGTATLESLSPTGRVRAADTRSLADASLRSHETCVYTRGPKKWDPRFTFRGTTLTLHTPPHSFALCSLRDQQGIARYVEALPPALNRLTPKPGERIEGDSDITLL
ncbi:MAG: hypothetical protein R3B68_07295 [Phycisphaerales bacterium]